MNLPHWTPFRELDDLLSGYRTLFARPGADGDDPKIDTAGLAWRPTADVVETETAFIVKAVLPAVNREDIRVSVEDGALKIEGERRYEKTSSDEKLHRTESLYGSFYRAFTLPKNIDPTAIAASYRNGVLAVTLPKVDKASPESVRIDVG